LVFLDFKRRWRVLVSTINFNIEGNCGENKFLFHPLLKSRGFHKKTGKSYLCGPII
jgi:hypothetical protein